MSGIAHSHEELLHANTKRGPAEADPLLGMEQLRLLENLGDTA
jgi:hypothetical protein